MAKTFSTMMPLGTKAPDFTLPDTISGNNYSLQDLRGKTGTLVMFICNHCPYVIHLDKALASISKEYSAKGIHSIAINSNDIENYPEDAPNKMKEKGIRLDYDFPYLYDEDQTIAKAYAAACTPDFFLFDSALQCFYRGQFDDSRPGNDLPITGKDLRSALEALLADKPANPNQQPSMGCNIKWK